MPYTHHPVRQYPNKKGQPGAGTCEECPRDYLPAEGGGSGNGTSQRVSGYTRSYPVKQANKKMSAIK